MELWKPGNVVIELLNEKNLEVALFKHRDSSYQSSVLKAMRGADAAVIKIMKDSLQSPGV